MEYEQKRRFRKCCFSTIFILVLLGIVALVLWLILRPYPPRFYLTALCATAMSSPANCSRHFSLVRTSEYPQGAILYALDITNRDNELGIFYDDLNVTINFESRTCGRSVQPGFYQGHKQSTRQLGWVDGSSVPWANIKTSQAAPWVRLLVPFDVSVDGSYRFKGVVVEKTGLHVVALRGKALVDADGRMTGESIRLLRQ